MISKYTDESAIRMNLVTKKVERAQTLVLNTRKVDRTVTVPTSEFRDLFV